MERRNRSLEALDSLNYIDSLDDHERAPALVKWMNQYISNQNIEDCIELEQKGLEQLSELFYKNLNFLKTYRQTLQNDMKQIQKVKTFLN